MTDNKAATGGCSMVSISVPIAAAEPAGRVSTHIVVRINQGQSMMLMRVLAGLHAGDYRRANGQHVDKAAQVLPWILDELIAKEAELRQSPDIT